MSAHKAQLFKEEGNKFFTAGDYKSAEECYTKAITKDPSNPLLFTNRAFARLKLRMYEGVVDDCLLSIERLPENMKAYYYLAQAQLGLHHPNEALSSALRAYELALKSRSSSTGAISSLVLQAKKEKWEAREKERVRRRKGLLSELESSLDQRKEQELRDIQQRQESGEIGSIEADEEREEVEKEHRAKIEELRRTFAAVDPENVPRKPVPDWLIDSISFAVMHDPVITKNGHSYERATILEHLHRSPTDPLTREPLKVEDLRPNLQLKQACDDYLEENGWAVDW